jgi:flagellar biosynthesis protein FliQ
MASNLTAMAQEALTLCVALSLPILGVAALVSLLVAVAQAATQVQDITISFLPRFLAVAAALAIAGPWIGAQLSAFAARIFAGG